jgi:WD40 repeat protein/tRNA A-37 threonylcarbamoyl transferase component Bud32
MASSKDSGDRERAKATGKGSAKEPQNGSGSAETQPSSEFAETADSEALAETAAPAHTISSPAAAAKDIQQHAQGALESLVTVPKDHYRVEEEIARGGMGRISIAQDRRHGRRVAIKELLRPSAETRARFEREAMVTARLQHPAIVPLYEAGRWPDGEPFFAMKMVAGTPLDKVVRAAKTADQRLALLPRVIDVADALAYAHSMGVIHRDLKPANVLVGDFGETVVIDWGLAKIASVPEIESKESAITTTEKGLTVVGQAMGTPAYMPPEQVVGWNVDARADVYALGAMLYHVLGGKMAYADSRSVEEILSKVLEGPPEPLEDLAPGVPLDLLTIVNKAMARQPEQRYGNASAFAEDLRRFETGKRVAAHSYSLTALMGRWIRRHRTGVAVAAVVACVLAVTAIWSFLSVREQRDAARGAQASAVAKSQELGLSLASSFANEEPLRALRELGKLKDLASSPANVRRARMIAALVRSRSLPSEWTAAGSNHGAIAVSPDNKYLAVAKNHERIALVSLKDKSVRVLPVTDLGSINVLSFSPSGKWLAVGTLKGELVLLKMGAAAKGMQAKEKKRLKIRPNIVQIAFPKHERWLAVRARRHVFVVQLGAKDDIKRIPLFSATDLAISPDGSRLAIAAEDALLYEPATGALSKHAAGREMKGFPGRRESFSRVAFAPDGALVVFADKRVIAVDIASSKSEELFSTTDRVLSLAFDDKGSVVAAGARDRIIYLYGFKGSAGALSTLTGHEQPVTGLLFAAGKRELISAGRGGQLRLWKLTWMPGGKRLYESMNEVLVSERGKQPPLLFDQGTKLLAYDRLDVLRLWDRKQTDHDDLGAAGMGNRSLFVVGRDKLIWSGGGHDHKLRLYSADGATRDVGDHGEQVELIAFSPDQRFAATGGKKRLMLWNLEKGSGKELVGHKSSLRYLAFAGDDALVSTDLMRGVIYRWNLSGEGRRIGQHGAKLNSYVATASDPRGRWVVTAGRDKKVLLHSLIDGGATRLAEVEVGVGGMAVSPSGDRLAMSLRGGEISIFDPTGKRPPVRRHSGDDRERLRHPRFSPDGKSLAATNSLNGIRVWRDWQKSNDNLLLVSRYAPSLPRFSRDSARIVASGGSSGTVSIWDIASGQRRDLHSLGTPVHTAFWPQAKRIVSSGYDGKLKLWRDDLPTEWTALLGWITAEVRRKTSPPRLGR